MLHQFYKKLHMFIRHHWLTVAFIFGFVLDNITLNRVDQLFDNIVLLSYVILAMISIVLFYAGTAERFNNDRLNNFLKTKSPILMQYAFGGLLSGMLIFYGRSSSFVDNWPFIIIILGVIYGNETIKKRGQRLVYNFVIFFIGLFTYVTLIVPVLLGKMGPLIFVGSGLLVLVIISVFFNILSRIVPNFIELQKRSVVFSIGLVYVLLNVFYFTNIIPPIPLSLKHIGIYHSVVRNTALGTYTLQYETPKWWEWYRKSDSTYHYSTGESIYCYASVFAPTRLSTKIYQRWEYYDESLGSWKEHARMAYGIEGGRSEGYRGHSEIENYHEGKWRCIVETERGQIIGKETFQVSKGIQPALITRIE